MPLACPVLATLEVPSSPTRSRVWQTRAGRLVFIGLDNVFYGIDPIYDCLDRVTADFFYAYSVLAKP